MAGDGRFFGLVAALRVGHAATSVGASLGEQLSCESARRIDRMVAPGFSALWMLPTAVPRAGPWLHATFLVRSLTSVFSLLSLSIVRLSPVHSLTVFRVSAGRVERDGVSRDA